MTGAVVVPGPARLLASAYALFALAAGARSITQLVTHPDRAPLAYALSAFAAAVYLVATLALRRPGPAAHRVALAACTTELVGVLLIGSLTIAAVDAFPDDTVWSRYGQGYGHLPLILPLLGIAWLRHATREPHAAHIPTPTLERLP